MARTKSMTTIETEIAESKKIVIRTKAKYEATIANLEAVMAKIDEYISKDLLNAFKKSGKSYDVVMRYLKEGLRS